MYAAEYVGKTKEQQLCPKEKNTEKKITLSHTYTRSTEKIDVNIGFQHCYATYSLILRSVTFGLMVVACVFLSEVVYKLVFIFCSHSHSQQNTVAFRQLKGIVHGVRIYILVYLATATAAAAVILLRTISVPTPDRI